jgi:hypothetical protein
MLRRSILLGLAACLIFGALMGGCGGKVKKDPNAAPTGNSDDVAKGKALIQKMGTPGK